MSDDAERRIEAAAAQAARQKEAREFLEGLTKNDEILRPVRNPEAYVMREKARGAASRGELPRNDCRHPFQYLQQYTDDDPAVQRRGRPVNLFACGVCGMLLWLVDPWGESKADE
jgi:hypothetical protein